VTQKSAGAKEKEKHENTKKKKHETKIKHARQLSKRSFSLFPVFVFCPFVFQLLFDTEGEQILAVICTKRGDMLIPIPIGSKHV
jgi:hypothetical protein